MKAVVLFTMLLVPFVTFAQPTQDDPSVQTGKTKKHQKGTAADIGGGVGSTAGGVARGAGSAAKGVGKGAADLATLHPLSAGEAVGGGAVTAGKDVTVGTAKGAGKIGKGIGHALKKIL